MYGVPFEMSGIWCGRRGMRQRRAARVATGHGESVAVLARGTGPDLVEHARERGRLRGREWQVYRVAAARVRL